MRRIALLFVLPLLASSSLASADEPAGQTFGATPRWEKTKSPEVSLAMSLGVTAAGFGLAALDADDFTSATGVILALAGPYSGYAYTGDLSRALRVGLVQGAGLSTFLVGVSLAYGDWDESEGDDPQAGELLMLAGGLTFVGAAVFAIVDSHASAKRFNERARRLRLGPSPIVGPSRKAGLGLSLSGSF